MTRTGETSGENTLDSESFYELVLEVAGDEEIVGCDAHLAGVSALAPEKAARSELDIAARVDVDRVLSSQLK